MPNTLTAESLRALMIESRNTGGIVTGSHGGTTITGKGMELARILSLKSGLSLESKGIRLTRGFSCLAVARKQYGIKAASAAKAHAIISAMIVEATAGIV